MLIIPTAESRNLDLICLGRGGVDFCAEQWEQDFADVRSFTKQIGGSAANTAVGAARLGQRVGFISCLSADPIGQYVPGFLANETIDVQHCSLDNSGTRTSLAHFYQQPRDFGRILP